MRQPVHTSAVEQICAGVRAELAADVQLHWLDDPTEMLTRPGRVQTGASLVISPGTDSTLSQLFGAHWPPGGRVIRVDFGARDRDESPGLAAHVQARGLDGLLWAIRSAVHHERERFLRSSYGTQVDQFGELLLPAERVGRCPVAVLIHGGYWHDRWQLDLMDGLAADLAGHGIAAWNIEYRRPDLHGWAATTADVEAATCHLRQLAARYPIDPARVLVLGHSAGAQLAARVSADLVQRPGPIVPIGCVALAGVMDLVAAAERELGERATQTALGAEPAQDLAAYLAASPIHRAPIGVRTAVVTAESDNRDLTEMSWRYIEVARAGRDRVDAIHGEGGHFTVIDTASAVWQQTRQIVEEMLQPGNHPEQGT